jgi:glutamate---cysteine ligase / carboxylate-amine ligase
MAAGEPWYEWTPAPDMGPYSVGVEEEVMLLDPSHWDLANRIDDVLRKAPGELTALFDAETHGSVVELRSWVHSDVSSAMEEISKLRAALS